MSWLQGPCLALLYETVPTILEAAPKQKPGFREESLSFSLRSSAAEQTLHHSQNEILSAAELSLATLNCQLRFAYST